MRCVGSRRASGSISLHADVGERKRRRRRSTFPTAEPLRSLRLRLRLPDGRRIRAVFVDGVSADAADGRGDDRTAAGPGHIDVEAVVR